jgi:hypothetical protein
MWWLVVVGLVTAADTLGVRRRFFLQDDFARYPALLRCCDLFDLCNSRHGAAVRKKKDAATKKVSFAMKSSVSAGCRGECPGMALPLLKS